MEYFELDKAIEHCREVAELARKGRYQTPDVKEAEELFTQFADWLEEVKSLRCKLQECRRMIEALTRDDFNELFEVHLRKQEEE